MSLTEIIFLLFAGVALIGATFLSFSRQLIRAAFWLLVVLLAVAALFAFIGADVLTVSQLIVYVGGILILIVYGVMLTRREDQQRESPRRLIPSLLALVIPALGLFWLIRSFDVSHIGWAEHGMQTDTSNVEAIGRETVTNWVVPFEVVSILLLIALVGAAFLARPDQKEKTPPD